MSIEIKKENGRIKGRVPTQYNPEQAKLKREAEELERKEWLKERNRILDTIADANNLHCDEYKGKVQEKNTQNTKNKKRNLKNKPSKGKWLGRIAIAVASLTLLAILIDNARKDNQIEPTTQIPTTEFAEKVEDKIDTIREVEEDFVKDYLEAYNKKNGTNYKSGEMLITALRDGAVYKLEDGRIVTRGSKPYETENKLGQLGSYEMINGYDNVVQIISEGRTLGTYNLSTGEFIYTGNQLEDVTNTEFDEPTLEDLGINQEKLKAAARVKLAKNVEDNISIENRIEYYNEVDGEER